MPVPPKDDMNILPTRHSPRLPGYDYAQENYYYVTICTGGHRCIFGLPENQTLFGKIAAEELQKIAERFSSVRLDAYVIMPNHIHAIIVIGCDMAERASPFPTLSTVIGSYKSGVSRRIHQISPNVTVWQKSFYDHIIRNEEGYQKIWQYIKENPLKWQLDKYYSL